MIYRKCLSVVLGIYSKFRRRKSSNLKFLRKYAEWRYSQFFGNKNRLGELRERSISKSCIETPKSASRIGQKCGESAKIGFCDLGCKICSDSSKIWFLRGVMDTLSIGKPRSSIGWPCPDPFQYLQFEHFWRHFPLLFLNSRLHVCGFFSSRLHIIPAEGRFAWTGSVPSESQVLNLSVTPSSLLLLLPHAGS